MFVYSVIEINIIQFYKNLHLLTSVIVLPKFRQ